ncbi:carbohydrate-binding module family 48 protein, partial [Cytidiella melzeri]
MVSSSCRESLFPTTHVALRRPHTDANSVIVTGEFDAWTGSHRLTRTANGFEGTVQVPWGRKIAYKYIVDGRWTTTDDQSTELDTIGNLNNIFHAPARP